MCINKMLPQGSKRREVAKKIYNKTKGEEYQGQAFPEFMQNIIQNGGLIKSISKK